jgi:hypothetical protein
MPFAQHAASVSATRKQALQSKHSALEDRLSELSHHPSASDFEIRQLKTMKLKLREEIEQLT